MNKNFLYKSQFFKTFFNSFCKKGKQASNERFFYSFLNSCKNIYLYNDERQFPQKYFIFTFLLLEYVYMYKMIFSIKLIRRGKFLYRIPNRIVEKNLYRYSFNNLLKTKKLKAYAPSNVKILIDKEAFILLIYENRLMTHYRW